MSSVRGIKTYPVHITIEVTDSRFYEIQKMVAALDNEQLDLLYRQLRDGFDFASYDHVIKRKNIPTKGDFEKYV